MNAKLFDFYDIYYFKEKLLKNHFKTKMKEVEEEKKRMQIKPEIY